LERLKDLYELGDLDRAAYARRKAKLLALIGDAEPVVDLDVERCVEFLANPRDLWESDSDPKNSASWCLCCSSGSRSMRADWSR
jgi:hypothetical protein